MAHLRDCPVRLRRIALAKPPTGKRDRRISLRASTTAGTVISSNAVCGPGVAHILALYESRVIRAEHAFTPKQGGFEGMRKPHGKAVEQRAKGGRIVGLESITRTNHGVGCERPPSTASFDLRQRVFQTHDVQPQQPVDDVETTLAKIWVRNLMIGSQNQVPGVFQLQVPARFARIRRGIFNGILTSSKGE